MKRIITIILVLAMSAAVLSGALAQPAKENFDLSELRKYERVNTLCWIGETLYILGDEGLYTWQHDVGARMLLDMKATAPLRYMEQPPEKAENEWKQAVHTIFTDGTTLYAMQQYSGSLYMLDGNSLVPWCTMPTEQLFSTGDIRLFRGIQDLVWAGDRLYLLIGSENLEQGGRTTLLAFDPATKQVSTCGVEYVQQLGIALDDKLLLIRSTNADLEISFYDPSSGMEEKQTILETKDTVSGGVIYDAEHHALIYCQGQDIIQYAADGTVQIKASLPLAVGSLSTKAQISDSGLYAGASGPYVFLRNIASEAAAQKLELCIMGDINPEDIVKFSMVNPDITIRTASIDTSESLQQAILTAGAEIDLYVVKAPGPFADMRAKGYLAPMNENATLVEKVKQMYPAVQEALIVGDELLGVPITVQTYAWTVNQTLWDQFDLGQVPSTYVELFDGLNRWEDELADDNPNYQFLDVDRDTTGYVIAMVREYVLQNEKPDAPLTFDTPAFHEALQAIIDNQNIIEEQVFKEGMPIIFTYSMGFGVGSNDGEKTVMMLPPTLGGGDQQALAASMEVLVLNPASEQKQEALRFVQFIAEQMDLSMQYMLTPSMTESARAGNYAENAAKMDDEIARLEEQTKTAPDDKKAEIADTLVTKKIQREKLENFAWLISPESVTCYRKLAENLEIPYASQFLSDEESSGMNTLEPIIMKFCAQGLTPAAVDAFVQELEGVARMIFQEGQ